MPQNPQDPNYGYNSPNESEHTQAFQPTPQQGYGQPMMVPVGIVQKTPEQLAGEKAAQTSTVLGIIGLVCVLFVNWFVIGLPSLILGVIGIMKANEAERFGTAASAGRIMSWISVVAGGLGLLLIGGFALLALMAAGSAASSSNHFTELVSTLTLF